VGGKIFINYRRKQSLAEAQHLATILAKEFGARRVFIDVRGIDGFSDWFETLKKQVEGTAAMISVIGKDWLSALDAKDYAPGEKTKDFARFEISEALRRNIPVLPVLLDGAAMPLSSQLPADMQGMLRLQAMDLTLQRFPEDAAAIVKQLKKHLGLAPWKVAALSAALAFILGNTTGTILEGVGVIQPASDKGLKVALERAERRASEADAQYRSALRERDQAIGAKEAAEEKARAAVGLAASEKIKRDAAEEGQQAALRVARQAADARDAAEKDTLAARKFAASEQAERDAVKARLIEASKRLEETQAALQKANAHFGTPPPPLIPTSPEPNACLVQPLPITCFLPRK
jgi:hypothetical protein